MISVSNNFLNAITSSSRELKTRMLINSTEYQSEKILDFSIEGDITADEQLVLGSTVCQSLSLNLLENATISDSSIIQVFTSINTGSTYEEIQLGVYNVDIVDKVKTTKKISAYDNMIKFEKPYISKLIYPQTITAIINEICSTVGVAFSGTLPDMSIVAKIQGITMRSMISIIASKCGGIARINNLGALEIINVSTSSQLAITSDQYTNLKVADNPFTIKKITAVKADGNTISSGTGESKEEITFNNDYISQAELDNSLTKVLNLTYYSGTVEMKGMPMLQIGDMITITDTNNISFNILVMNQNLTYSGGLKHTISSIAKTENKSNCNFTGTISDSVQKITQRVDTLEANEIIAKKATITQANIVDLTVNHLQTLPASAIENEADYLNYVDSQGKYMKWITATKNTTKPKVQLLDIEGNPLYWTDETKSEKTTDNTNLPAMVYQYDYLEKLKIYFDTDDANAFPIIEFGAGDLHGNNKGIISKTFDGFSFSYLADDGVERYLYLKKDGLYYSSDGTNQVNLTKTSTKIKSNTDGTFTMNFNDGTSDTITFTNQKITTASGRVVDLEGFNCF